YLYDEQPVNLLNLPFLNLSKPCFIRIGVYAADGKPLIFGQPVVVMGVFDDSLTVQQPDENQIRIFPNPASDHLFIETDIAKAGNYKVMIFNEASQETDIIVDRYFYPGKYGFRYLCNKLSSGSYVIAFTGNDRKISRKLIIGN